MATRPDTDGKARSIEIESISSRRGLTSVQAAELPRQFGSNLLPAAPRPSLWKLVCAQMVHFFALMLWVAGAMAILAGMPQLGIAIFVVILLNGTFAFAQEYRAERASEKLRELLPRRVMVFRDGAVVILRAEELVPEDLVVLHAGDRVSADMQLIEVHSLSVDVSPLTGESVPVQLEAGQALFAGTLVREGEGMATVTATGKATRLASIAQMTRASQRPRTLRSRHRVSSNIRGNRFSVDRRACWDSIDRGVSFRSRRLRSLSARRIASDGDPLAGHGCAAYGGPTCVGSQAGVRRNTGFHNLHLHG